MTGGDSDETTESGGDGTASGGDSSTRARDDGDGAAEPRPRCDYCRLPCPTDPVTDGEYEFCSRACREAMDESDRISAEYHGFRCISPGVAGLDAGLPEGLPRNAFVLLSGQAGTRDGAVHAELVWRTLQRGEPAVVVTFQDPPGAVVQRFLNLEWNVLPYLESDQLGIVDCFTYRVEDRDRMFERMNEWNQHLYAVADDATTSVRDPSDLDEVRNKLDNRLAALSMSDRGVVVVDSLTELGALVQPVQAYDFVKDVRADVCKGRFVPVFAGATYGDTDAFPHDLSYLADGVVDMQLNNSIVEDTLIKRVRVRKMTDALAIPEWTAYEYTAETGMVTFDPLAEMEKSEAARAEQSGGSSDDGDTAAPPDDDSAGADDRDDASTTAGAASTDDSGASRADQDAVPDGAVADPDDRSSSE